jgi:hypothetical protein
VSITRRDVAIMELLVERRAETLDELATRFFAERSRKRAQNRLGTLAGAGYLQCTKLAVPSLAEPQNIYTLGPKGKRALELRSSAALELFRDRRFNPSLRTASLPHQIVTNRVADVLGMRMTPEHLLEDRRDRESRAVRPDGVYLAGRPDDWQRQVWVEVDLGHYSRKRIEDKVRAAIANHDVRGMLLVCATQRRADQVHGWLDDDHRLRHSSVHVAVLSLDELSLEALEPQLRPAGDTNPDLPVLHSDGDAWKTFQ